MTTFAQWIEMVLVAPVPLVALAINLKNAVEMLKMVILLQCE